MQYIDIHKKRTSKYENHVNFVLTIIHRTSKYENYVTKIYLWISSIQNWDQLMSDDWGFEQIKNCIGPVLRSNLLFRVTFNMENHKPTTNYQNLSIFYDIFIVHDHSYHSYFGFSFDRKSTFENNLHELQKTGDHRRKLHWLVIEHETCWFHQSCQLFAWNKIVEFWMPTW